VPFRRIPSPPKRRTRASRIVATSACSSQRVTPRASAPEVRRPVTRTGHRGQRAEGSRCDRSELSGAKPVRRWTAIKRRSRTAALRHSEDHRGDLGGAGDRECPDALGSAGPCAAAGTCAGTGAAGGLSAVNHHRSSGVAPQVAAIRCVRGFPGRGSTPTRRGSPARCVSGRVR
jgi:hypothetical protein